MEARRLRRQEQKRKLLMRQRVLAAVLLVIFVLSLILILRGCRNRREHPELYAKKDTTLQLETEPDTTVTISAVGDIMITDELLADAKQPDGSYKKLPMVGPVLNSQEYFYEEAYKEAGDAFHQLLRRQDAEQENK